MAKSGKKKEKINLEELDINQLLEEAVATSRTGRVLASLGAILTGREKHDAGLVYLLLKAGKEYTYTWKYPVKVKISEEPENKKYTPLEAIAWFAENYPQQAGPLLRKLEEEYKKPKTEISYGLKGAKDLPDGFYIETLSKILNISSDRAIVLYHSIIKPHLSQQEEKDRLASLAIKPKD